MSSVVTHAVHHLHLAGIFSLIHSLLILGTGPDAPLDLERGLCASHMEHAYDFYKPCGFYPMVRETRFCFQYVFYAAMVLAVGALALDRTTYQDLLALLWPLKLAQCLLLMLFLPREVNGIENIDWSCSQLLMPLRCQGDAGACVGGWQGLCGLLPHGARPLLLQPVREIRAATEASQKWQRNCTAAAPR